MTDYHPVLFEPLGVSAQVETGMTLMDATIQDIPIRFDCGGKGICGKCRVIAEPAVHLSAPSESEAEVLGPDQLAKSVRLACQARILGPIKVTVPEQMADSREARGKTDLAGTFPLDPMVSRIVLPPAAAPVHAGSISSNRGAWLCERAAQEAGRSLFFRDHDALRQLSRLDNLQGALTLVQHRKKGVTAVLSGSHRRALGLAVDIGTTTVAVYLCDLGTGRILASAASVNPQRRFGEDVISRISFADTEKTGLETMQALIVETLNYLADRCLQQAGGRREAIDEVTVVGNTTMEQVFAGFHPHGLGVSPYMPAVRTPLDLRAVELGLSFNPGTNVHLFPVISGFVGGDTMAAIIADAPQNREAVSLIIDIGTNGELVLGNRNGLWSTSCATGPALEGAHISTGMRAVSGAIHKVDIDASSGEIRLGVIGEEDGARPVGLCGSGIIDAVAAMRRCGIILPSGRFQEGMPGVVCDDRGIGRRFVLVPAEKSVTGKDIALSLQDVRQIQLAKGALLVGIELLMERAGFEAVAHTVLTGAFGARFNWRNAVTIGMLPLAAVSGEVLSRDNLAGIGAIMALLDRKARFRARELAREVNFIELADEPNFQMRFVRATQFPVIDASGWPRAETR